MDLLKLINTNAHYLLISSDAARERDGMSELWHVLVKYCNITPIEVFELPIKGLFLFAIHENPLNTLKQIA